MALPLNADGSFYLPGPSNAPFVKQTTATAPTQAASVAQYVGTWAIQGDDDFRLTISSDGSWKMVEAGTDGGASNGLAGQKITIGKIGTLPQAPAELANIDAIVLFADALGQHPVAAMPLGQDGSFYMPGPENRPFVKVAS